jgi:hypothetical protein
VVSNADHAHGINVDHVHGINVDHAHAKSAHLPLVSASLCSCQLRTIGLLKYHDGQ